MIEILKNHLDFFRALNFQFLKLRKSLPNKMNVCIFFKYSQILYIISFTHIIR